MRDHNFARQQRAKEKSHWIKGKFPSRRQNLISNSQTLLHPTFACLFLNYKGIYASFSINLRLPMLFCFLAVSKIAHLTSKRCCFTWINEMKEMKSIYFSGGIWSLERLCVPLLLRYVFLDIVHKCFLPTLSSVVVPLAISSGTTNSFTPPYSCYYEVIKGKAFTWAHAKNGDDLLANCTIWRKKSKFKIKSFFSW